MNSLSIDVNRSETQVSNIVKGLARMKNYYSDVLYPYISNLISAHSKKDINGYYLDVDDLYIDDKYEFAVHLIEYDDRELYCLTENEKYQDIVSSLIKLLNKDDLDSKLDFSDLIKNKVINYYKEKMQCLIDSIIPDVQDQEFLEMGMIRIPHDEPYEKLWVRSWIY